MGSTRLVTNQTGAVVSRHDYLPFGWELYSGLTGRTSGHGYLTSPEGIATPTQRFTGKERDSETRLDYFGARYYSAGPGRFTSADAPFADQHTDDPQSWNLYSYVRNNPLAFVDSTGRCLHPYQAAQCGVGLGQRRMTPKEAEYTAKGVAIGTGAAASVAAGPGILAWGGALVRAAFGWALGNPVTSTAVAVGAVEAGIGLEGPGASMPSLPVKSTEEAFEAALKNGPEFMAGFRIDGAKQLVGNVLDRSIFAIKAESGASANLKGLSNLVGALESDAKIAGASFLRITGHAIHNSGFLNPKVAERFGFKFKKIDDETVELIKEIR